MSNHFYGMNRGQNDLVPSSVQIGTSTNNTDVEVRVADGQNLTRKDVDVILEAIRRRIQTDPTIPILPI